VAAVSKMSGSKENQHGGSSPLAGKSIIFVGGGAFGLSAAYHLAQRIDLGATGTSVTVLDRFDCPSPIAASTDLNKIVRSDYSEPLYARLGGEAMAEWKKPTGIYAGMFQQIGWFLAAESVSIPFIEASVESQKAFGLTPSKKISAAEARQISPAFTGSMNNWQIWWNPSAGWTTSGDAMTATKQAAASLGVRYVSGQHGWVKKLLYNDEGACIGAESANGTRYYADMVVLSAGAVSPELVDLKGQMQAKGHVVGHIQLAPEEVEQYKSMKIVDHFEQGIIFPPNRDGIIKVATVNFVTNFENPKQKGLSLARFREDYPSDGIPEKIEKEIRDWMRQFIPTLADRPWIQTRICW
jgi:sarcosine oxidase / L-pipecolate oxidase